MASRSIFMMIILLFLALVNYSSQIPTPNATCPTICGNLTIPFPFGTSSECSLDESFLITCNHTYTPSKAFLDNVEVLDISLDGAIRVSSSVAKDCYDSSGAQITNIKSEIVSSKFPISSKRNKFTAVGCDTHALVEGSDRDWKQMTAGCISTCDSTENVVNGTCSGIGCCQTSIPKGVRDSVVDVRSFRNHTRVKDLNPCSYAFVVEADAFKFSSLDLKDFQNRTSVPVSLDWSVGTATCLEALKNVSSYACRANHSECSDLSNGVGYRCSCLTGFEGNPYHVDGCQDVDECVASKPCSTEGTCTNLQGSYSCSCPEGFEGDGKKDGNGCRSKSKMNAPTPTHGSNILYFAYCVILFPSFGYWVILKLKKAQLSEQREECYIQNGGHIIDRSRRRVKMFTADQLEEATNKYRTNTVLNRKLDPGVSYEGNLQDGNVLRSVTIQTCDAYVGFKSNKVAFTTNISILSDIYHRNITNLIGCCLETPTTVLVYESVYDRTLHDYLHDRTPPTWNTRMWIAEQIARALSYLHNYKRGGVPIIHGMLNSHNILVDLAIDVKLYDLGGACAKDTEAESKLGLNQYLGPEFKLIKKFTKKNDVYSFGIVLAELLTGENVIRHVRERGEYREYHIAQYFDPSLTGDDLLRILDPRMDTEGKIEQITQVAMLAEWCLSDSPEDRPKIEDVMSFFLNGAMMAERCLSYSLEDRPIMEDVMGDNFSPTTISAEVLPSTNIFPWRYRGRRRRRYFRWATVKNFCSNYLSFPKPQVLS